MSAPSTMPAPAGAGEVGAAATGSEEGAAPSPSARALDGGDASTASVASRAEFAYCACYCEENAYLLIKRLLDLQAQDDSPELYAVFVSNERRAVPVWRQSSSSRPEGLALWDYHVLAIHRRPPGSSSSCTTPDSLVYDLDTTLEPFPCTFEDYRREALRDGSAASFERSYRVVPASVLLARFSSDRSHMRRADGTWTSPPPPWPLIGQSSPGAAAVNNTLPLFLDMRTRRGEGDDDDDDPHAPPGLLLDERGLVELFAPALEDAEETRRRRIEAAAAR